MVWQLAAEPRIVKVNMIHRPRPLGGQSKIAWRTSRNPDIMLVCVEARQATLRVYKRLFFICPVPVTGVAPPAAVVWFHPHLDVLSQDFEPIIRTLAGPDRVRRPGVKTRLPLAGTFDDIIRPVAQPVLPGLFDPRRLRHIHLNLHLINSSLQNNAALSYPILLAFLQNLMARPALQSLTVRITRAGNQPNNQPAANTNLHTKIFRLIRTPLALGTRPDFFVYTDLRAEHLALAYAGVWTEFPRLAHTLSVDGVCLAQPCTTDWVVLRVIDARSNLSEYDDAGTHWIAQRETLWQNMLHDGMSMQQNSPADWLATVISNAGHQSVTVSPWGICGPNYAMEDAKVYQEVQRPVVWTW